jgi:hypothetical protein
LQLPTAFERPMSKIKTFCDNFMNKKTL